MAQKLAITRELAWKIRQEYEERDERGNRRWSQAALAQRYMVSETTVFRAIKNYGAYGAAPLPEVKEEQALSQEAAMSLKNLLSRQGQVIPPSVLAASEGRSMTAAERMAQDAHDLRAKAARGDQFLNELTGGTGNGTAEASRKE